MGIDAKENTSCIYILCKLTALQVTDSTWYDTNSNINALTSTRMRAQKSGLVDQVKKIVIIKEVAGEGGGHNEYNMTQFVFG